MFKNFTEEYKKVLLSAESEAKNSQHISLQESDIFLEIMRIPSGAIRDLMSNYGLNERIVLDVLAHPKFNTEKPEKGEYTGPSSVLKNTIVSSIKIAASFEKSKAGIEDFLLALVKGKTTWFIEMLDFLGIIAKDFEQALTKLNTQLKQDGTVQNPLDPINKILSALESNFLTSMKDGGNEEGTIPGVPPSPAGIPAGGKKKNPSSETPALDFFCQDLIKEAKEKKIENIIGRDIEIERLISILNRKSKNNPCLVGEPGVGKTAVVEGLALRITEGTVPYAMQNKRVLALDLTSLIAGTKYRGEFEVRMKQVIEEASKLENEVILFIDEIHTIIGAGGSEGALDAANILKPAMGRGKIRIIGATTQNEYQKYIEKDSALERRFQKIDVNEPTPETAIAILQGIRESFEEYHNLIISDAAIKEAVDLSTRYITSRFLPDKAIDLIDEACSKKSMNYQPVSEEGSTVRKEISQLQENISSFIQSGQFEKAREAKTKLAELEEKNKKNKLKIPREKRQTISALDVQGVVHQTTGVPMKNLSSEEEQRLLDLPKILQKYIIGQDEAITSVSSSIRRNRAGIANKNRPIGSFLFLGPTGVGKTELVKVLAREFYGDEKALIRLDMSEFAERMSSSKLLGSAPGYVGYEEGGRLTEQVRRKPYSIVLFDELEKANSEVFNILLQILEDGEVTDNKGRKANFRNTVIIMTSNIGSEEFDASARRIGFDISAEEEKSVLVDFEKAKAGVLKVLEKQLRPEFLNRIDKTIVFRPLDTKNIEQIVTLQLEDLKKRLADNKIILSWKGKVFEVIAKKAFNPEFGARTVRRYIQDHIEDPIAQMILEKKIKSVTLSTKNGTIVLQ